LFSAKLALNEATLDNLPNASWPQDNSGQGNIPGKAFNGRGQVSELSQITSDLDEFRQLFLISSGQLRRAVQVSAAAHLLECQTRSG